MVDSGKLTRFYNLADLDQRGKVIAEYVWIDGSGITLRCKARTLQNKIEKLEDIPQWNFDGSSCYMASTHNSEVILKPVAFYPDPFRGGDNILVLCSTYVWADNTYKELIPANSNFRHFTEPIFAAGEYELPWFGIEQEYSLLETSNNFTIKPLGWPSSGFPGAQGPYYCSVGANNCYGRAVIDAHYKACLFAGVKISGTNCEVMPGQWEYQVGPCLGIEIGDQMWISRYLISRVAEDFNISVSFAPKLFKDWNGAGCHTNFSTETMRTKGGLDYLQSIFDKMAPKHHLHLELYGDNSQRLTGHFETSSPDVFSYGAGNRAASVRIPTSVQADNGRGYIEDRRPASDIDPYVVAALIIDTAYLETSMIDDLVSHYRTWRKWLATQSIVQA